MGFRQSAVLCEGSDDEEFWYGRLAFGCFFGKPLNCWSILDDQLLTIADSVHLVLYFRSQGCRIWVRLNINFRFLDQNVDLHAQNRSASGKSSPSGRTHSTKGMYNILHS